MSSATRALSSFKSIKLNDGRHIPGIGFGTWLIGAGDTVITQVDQALEAGFDHIDTAQAYRNEQETGEAIDLSGIERKDLWITTKFSGRDGLGIYESCEDSLKKLGIKYVDLYLIHHPSLAKPDIKTAWKEMEKLHKDGLAKSIGISNFQIDDLKELLASAEIVPAVNQILLHPYVWGKQGKLIEFQKEYDIATEGYSGLLPLTKLRGGPVDKPVAEIAEKHGIQPEQVLLAWVKAKGAVILTTSSKKERLNNYLAVADMNLSHSEVAAIDDAGSKQWSLQRLAANAALAFITARRRPSPEWQESVLGMTTTGAGQEVLRRRAVRVVGGAVIVGVGYVAWQMFCGSGWM